MIYKFAINRNYVTRSDTQDVIDLDEIEDNRFTVVLPDSNRGIRKQAGKRERIIVCSVSRPHFQESGCAEEEHEHGD